MMMDILQWSGTVLVIASYAILITRPRTAVVLTIVGCALAGLWAYLLTPTAWGVFTLEVFVLVMSLRNLVKLRAWNH